MAKHAATVLTANSTPGHRFSRGVIGHGASKLARMTADERRRPRKGPGDHNVSSSAVPLSIRYAQEKSELERVYGRCGDALYRYFAVRAGGQADLADDLMQQLWVQASRLEPVSDEVLERQLSVIARNLIRTHWRRLKRHGIHLPLPDPELAAELAQRLITETLPEDAFVRREEQDQLLLALTELPAGQQELLVGYYFSGRSQAELAGQLGISERAVEGRLRRARLALREQLQHLEPS